jgi:hypothetical protein
MNPSAKPKEKSRRRIKMEVSVTIPLQFRTIDRRYASGFG